MLAMGSTLDCASYSLAALIQMVTLNGLHFLALFKTF
jgi:hypothetical protein